MSRVSVMKGEESRLESLADPSMFGDVDENDPRSVARWARKLGEQLGDDLPDDYGEMVDQIESGEMPDDLGGDDSGMGGMGGMGMGGVGDVGMGGGLDDL